MSDAKESLFLGEVASATKEESPHIPSKIQADTLFTFTTSLEYIWPVIEKRTISPRYCIEDVSYLRIPNISKIAYPMKCFCDINLHRLNEHLDCYGYYGLAFFKDWGMRNHIQPVQYINPDSDLCCDFSNAFSAALKSDVSKESVEQKMLKDFLIHEMMFYKPYAGEMENRVTKEFKKKCFTDECEWRYVPDVTKVGFQQAYFDDLIFNAGILPKISDSMFAIPELSLPFAYSDLKHIIVKSWDDFDVLSQKIVSLGIPETEKHKLISKTIVWENSGGDF